MRVLRVIARACLKVLISPDVFEVKTNKAEKWEDEKMIHCPIDPTTLLHRYDDFPLQRPFAVQLVQRLREQGEAVAPVLRWLDQRLEAQGATAEGCRRGRNNRYRGT